MTTREEQFEINRQKMLGQMGSDEEAIEIEDVSDSKSDASIWEADPNWSP